MRRCRSLALTVLLFAASFAAPAPVAAQTFANVLPIEIVNGAVDPYPSQIAIVGAPGVIEEMRVALIGLTHSWPADVDVLLVGPGGQNLVLMSDAGGSVDIADVTLRFDDAAAESLPFGGPLLSGTYRPTNLGGTGTDVFAPPAPPLSGANAFTTFAGTDPNGIWSLYVHDDEPGDDGSLAGWSITLPEPAGAGAALFALGLLARRGREAGRR